MHKSPKSKPSLEAIESLDRYQEGLFEAADPADEGEDDLKPARPDGIRQAVVTGTDWTTETIIALIDRGTIELDPVFQRRDAWTSIRKSRFIESLVMGLPIPQIVLAERKDKRGQFVVLDGKQRLLALQQFAGKPRDGAERLVLESLVNLKDLEGVTFDEFNRQVRLADDLEAFRNQPIRTVVVKNWPDDDFLYLVFHRLNTGSVPLAAQELRQALHPGPFMKYSNDQSAKSSGLQRCLRIKKPDFRMRDVELMVRFYAFKMFIGSYAGNMKQFLDDACKHLNDNWKSIQPTTVALATELESSIEASMPLFEDGALFSVWRAAKTERRFNRAVFDVFTYYLSDPEVRDGVVARQDRVRKAFRELCVNDGAFLDSLQITTKSLGAVETRFAVFGRALGKALRMNVSVPRLIDNRLVLE